MAHYVVEQKHRGVWKTIARRPTRAKALQAVREIRATSRSGKFPMPQLRVLKRLD